MIFKTLFRKIKIDQSANTTLGAVTYKYNGM